LLASASGDCTIRLWNVDDGNWLHTMKFHTSLINSIAFFADGRIIASGLGDGTIRLLGIP